ncbi:Cys/Met metabolism PLP-dependent enzyme-domain-containing protein [Aspergillus arachidicola]|uniref:cystathionine gamma-lyase n=1 Tax=Aspergillus arachidicola TaxID=656916 RepID=A0A5N6XUH1_9EURO|nr:Cys/Met metabolism PLP-dependent enzyme-domain-containing protein [Aspergillus arachidicola]
MGAIALQDPTIYKNLAFIQNAAGSVPGPFDCWLAHRGVKPLHLRSLPASQNASTIAQILAASPHVLAVNHPGLSTHPQCEMAVKQHRGGLGGEMISLFGVVVKRLGGSVNRRDCLRWRRVWVVWRDFVRYLLR